MGLKFLKTCMRIFLISLQQSIGLITVFRLAFTSINIMDFLYCKRNMINKVKNVIMDFSYKSTIPYQGFIFSMWDMQKRGFLESEEWFKECSARWYHEENSVLIQKQFHCGSMHNKFQLWYMLKVYNQRFSIQKIF